GDAASRPDRRHDRPRDGRGPGTVLTGRRGPIFEQADRAARAGRSNPRESARRPTSEDAMTPASVILIVDDDRFGRKSLDAALAGQGYHVVLAESGPDALAKAADCRPDL